MARREQHHHAQDVRQGRIILDTPGRRAMFIAGLAGVAILPLALALLT